MRPCPDCGEEDADKVKSWNATPRLLNAQHIQIIITIWQCRNCGRRYRSAERTWRDR